MTQLAWQSVAQHIAGVRSGDHTVADIVKVYLERLAAYDSDLQSHVAINQQAMEQAELLDAKMASGQATGPLAGAVISVKDNLLTDGMATRAGTSVDALQFGSTDSNVVRRLREAGAIIIGKTRMHEFAWGNVTPPCSNPWDSSYVPGGSSGGSGAAVSAAMCGAAIGSDTGGSIRIPASLCGSVGLKPTFGLVGRGGGVPHSWSLDHFGPMARTVEDCALILESLAGFDPDDFAAKKRPTVQYSAACSQPFEGRSIGVIRNHFGERLSTEVEKAFQEALDWFRSQGVAVHEFEVPTLTYGLGAIFAIELASSSAYHDKSVHAGHTVGFDPDVRDLVDMGRLVTGVDYLHAEQVRTLMAREMAALLDKVDVIVTPSSPITAWQKGCWEVEVEGSPESVLAASWRFTYPFNLTGLPAISLPCGFDGKGLPIGLQIAGRPWDEWSVLAFANAYEQAHDWHTRKPTVYA